MSKIGDKVKKMIVNWLNIQPAPIQTVTLLERVPFELRVIENQIWYRGEATELDQFYKQTKNDIVTGSRFWGATVSQSTRKIHTGLPAMIVDSLAYLVKTDMDKVKFKNKNGEEKWNTICKNKHFDFTDIVGAGVVGALYSGDGAWKISANKEVCDVPIVEFYSADRVEYEIKHGIICGIDFITDVPHKRKVLKLKEKYRNGYVSYELYDNDRLLGEQELQEITGLNNVSYEEKSKFSMAVPFKIYNNPKYKNRGKSIFEDKLDDFDAFGNEQFREMRFAEVKMYRREDLIK